MGHSCCCHHHPTWTCNHGGHGEFRQLKTRLITILFFFIRCSRIKDREAGASWPGGFSLSLLILQWLPRRKLNNCYFLFPLFQRIRRVGQQWTRPNPSEAYEVLRRSSPVELHVLHATGRSCYQAPCWDGVWDGKRQM